MIRSSMAFIHKTGQNIEAASHKGGEAIDEIVEIIRKYVPAHTKKAIIQSLRLDLNAINYLNLNVGSNSRPGFRRSWISPLKPVLLNRRLSSVNWPMSVSLHRSPLSLGVTSHE